MLKMDHRNLIKCKIILTLFVFLGFYGRLQAYQEGIYFGTLTDEAGLSQMTISCIFQDSKGFLWFGTRDGLNRYDGYTCEVFRNDDSDNSTISNNNICSIVEDGSGDIWIATDNGLNCYHYASNNFTRYYKSSGVGGISHNKIGFLHYDRRGRLWIGTEQGLDLFNHETRSFTKTTLDGILFNNRILSVLCDSYGNLWIGTLSTGMIKYNPETGAYKIYRYTNGGSNKLPGNTVRTIFEDSRRNLWIGTKTGLCLYNGKSNSFQNFGEDIFKGVKLSNEGIRCIAEDWEKNLLIGTNEGYNILNPKTGELSIYNPSKITKGSINHFYIYSIFVDNAGTVWLGSYMGGINYYNKFNQQFKYINPGNLGQLVYGGVGPLAEMQDKLWIGTGGGGLFCYDKTRNTYSRHQLGDPTFLSNVIKALFIRNDTIYISNEEGKLFLFDTRKGKIIKSVQISNNPVINIYQASGGKLFLCVRDSLGLRLFNPKTGGCQPVTYRIPGDNRNMLFPFTKCIEKENDSILWIGTMYTGLYCYHSNTNSAVRYMHDVKNLNSLSNNQVSVIYTDQLNNLWIGTSGGGLCLFDRTTGAFKTYNEKEGLPNRIVLGILPDKAGYIWISTLSGISRFDLVNKSFKNYNFGNGFPLQEPAENSYSKLADGSLCIGGNNGIVIFDPEKIISNSFSPPIIITEFKLLDSDLKKENSTLHRKFIPNNDYIRLKYYQSSFVIQYTALNYIFPDKNQYSYQLEGFDYDWNDVGKQRIAIYTKLHAGDYRFKVKASNNDGVWNEEFASLNIKVLPPPWLAWYAYVFYFFLFAGLSFILLLFIRLENRVKIKQIEKENLEKAHQLRIRMFTNFSHELRTPLTLIIGPLTDMLNRTDIGQSLIKPLTQIQQNAHRLLLIVNQLMDFRKQESGKMQLRAAEGNIAIFIKEISLAFSELARKQKINCYFKTINDDISLWFDRQLLEKVFFNLLSNAFKNTQENGEIRIIINLKKREELKNDNCYTAFSTGSNTEEFVEIIISDNGKGISEENLIKIFDPFYQVYDEKQGNSTGTGIGLSLCKGFVELHSGFICAESRPGKGASFKVLLPRGKQHLKDDEIIHDFRDGEDHSHYMVPIDTQQPDDAILTEPNPEHHTVLIIEDNPEVRNYIRTHLGDAYNIIVAKNGNEGFAKAVETIPDLIISDVMMPGMDGLELCHKLKTDINTCHIPIILLTALAGFTQIKHGFEVGSDDYITKPFDPGALKIKVNSLICNRERLRKAFSNKFPFEQDIKTGSTADQEFLDKIFSILDKHISDSEFSLDIFSGEIGMSRANLYRKIKALSNFAPNELIKNYRLRAAVRLIKENKNTVSEISYRVGFSTPAYFSNCFKKTYGVSPSEYTGNIIPEK